MSSPEGRPCQDGQNHLVRFQMLLCALPPPEAPRGFPPLRMPDAECPAVLEAARGSAAAAASLESASLRGVHATLPQVSIQVQVRLPAALQRCLLQ